MNLKSKWKEFGSTYVKHNPYAVDAVWDLIEAKYSEPYRYYHNLSHLEHCIYELEDLSKYMYHGSTFLSFPITCFSIFFHDIMYETFDVFSLENEEKSLKIALEVLKLFEIKDWDSRIKDMILSTKDHVPKSDDTSLKIFLDIDLSILGQNEQKYAEYEENIRKEYFWVPNEIYSFNRKKILKSILDRDFIYNYSHFRLKYEEQAKENLKNAISRL